MALAFQRVMEAGGGRFHDGTITKISAGGVFSYHTPSDNNDAARGAKLAEVLSGAAAGDEIQCVPNMKYKHSAPFILTASNARLHGNGAKLMPTAEMEYVLRVTASAGTESLVSGVEVDADGANVTLSAERGEGVKMSGSGRVTLRDSYVHNCAVGGAASCVRTYDSGLKTLHRVRVDNPGWACVHIRSYECDVIDCDVRVSAAKSGAKSRWFDMDAANFGHVRVRGGRWWTDQAINAQSVFDPGTGNNCSQLTLEDIDIDCGANLTNDSTPSAIEGVIKPDEITQVVIKDVRQRHGDGSYQYLLWLGAAVDYLSVTDTHADGIIHAGDGSGINIEETYVTRSSFGRNATDAVKHAMDNLRAYRYLELNACKFFNLIGAGSRASGLRCAFNNLGVTADNFVRMRNCYFDSNWSEVAVLFRSIPQMGYLGSSRNTVNNRGSGVVLADTATQRLMASPSFGDPFTARLQWRGIRNAETLAPLSLNVNDHGHPQPSDTTDWAALVGPPGSKIRNMDPEGNSLQDEWNLDGLGDYV